ncbi:hypothetical protein [Lysinibacillus capsici]|uniref:hypothetical protein n=1 Tax=Lysinibacillus capsici TaxID=2115968 RepID=UPI002A807788|nr:hypothetical protein [Lysinibacillus capsici]
MGVQLFQQQGRDVVLTEFGVTLAEKAQNLIALEQHIETFIADYRLARTGNLHIVATFLPANFFNS